MSRPEAQARLDAGEALPPDAALQYPDLVQAAAARITRPPALIVMATLMLVLPVFTTSTPAGTYSGSQLAFVAVTSAALWAIFIFVQTVRHRTLFIYGVPIPVVGDWRIDAA